MNSLLYITWSVDPEAFVIPFIDWPVRWYGILFVAGLLLSQYILFYVFEKDGRTKKNVEDLTVYVVIGTILGARLGHVIFYDPAYYLENPAEIIMIWKGGLASHGGALGILIAVYLYCRKFKFSLLWLLDRLVIVVCLTAAFIRIGNLMNSEIIGKVTTLSWGFIFKNAYPISLSLDPRHPTQLYEALYSFILMGILFYLWKRFRLTMKNGMLFGLFLIILFSLRFLNEFVKLDQEAFESEMLFNMGQILSIPFILAGIIILWRSFRKKNSLKGL